MEADPQKVSMLFFRKAKPLLTLVAHMRQCSQTHSFVGVFIMISKILAGVLAAAVLSVGGYAYWQYANGNPECTHEPACPSSSPVAAVPPCCQEPSRTQAPAKPCCDCDDESSTEVLTIQPRELK